MAKNAAKFLLAVIAALLLISLFTLLQGPAKSQEVHTHAGGSKPGDYGFRHDEFHSIYKALRKADGSDCCNGSECRVTEEPREASAEEKKQGYDYSVLVDGVWCPVSVKEKQILFSPAQRERAKSDPYMQNFLSYSHVCAPDRDTQRVYREWRFGTMRESGCPTIYCVINGTSRM